MKTFPDTHILTQHLSDILPAEYLPIEIVSRVDYIESSTYPVEIVNCKTGSGEQLNLFCKYLGGRGPNNHGHRGGVRYEAKMYERVLVQSPCSKIRYYGQFNTTNDLETALIFEFMGSSLHLNKSMEADPLSKGAEWIGKFHHLQQGNAPAFVTLYDRKYYRGWSDRFRNLVSHQYEQYPWFETVADFFDANIAILLSGNQTIIHGEYYPHNILLKDGITYPVDWESAAVAAGEIDLASLIERWDEDATQLAIETYKKNRWNGTGPDEAFEKRLLLSQLYFIFRWWSEFGTQKDPSIFQRLLQLSKKAEIE
jgi:hypothetical protein